MDDVSPRPQHEAGKLLQDFAARHEQNWKLLTAADRLLNAIVPANFKVSLTGRVKVLDSFSAKANKIEDGKLRYDDPIEQIEDLVGLRIVVLAKRNVNEVCGIIRENLSVVSEEDKSAQLLADGKLGYESYHFVVRLGESRASLAEYKAISDVKFEIQVRTALQHAWAENEHKIQYKRSKNPELVKRFLRLSAAVSSADEEFDRIYEINESLQQQADADSLEALPESLEGDEQTDPVVSAAQRVPPTELVKRGELGQAIGVYTKLIAQRPKQATFYVGRARAEILAGELEAANSDIEKAEALSPNHPAVRRIRAFYDEMN